jgi:hypothetical protein
MRQIRFKTAALGLPMSLRASTGINQSHKQLPPGCLSHTFPIAGPRQDLVGQGSCGTSIEEAVAMREGRILAAKVSGEDAETGRETVVASVVLLLVSPSTGLNLE